MSSLDTEFHRRLAKQLAESIGDEMRALASGALEYPEYKRVCGRLKAFQEVTEMCKQIEDNINQGK